MSIGSSQRVRLIDGEKYTVKAIIDFDNERYYLYISGANRYDDDRTTVIPLGEDVYLGNFDFRGNGNDPAMFRFGTNAVDTQATLYSVTACRLGAVAPEIRVENTTANVQLSGGTASYELDYSVTPADAEVTVTCDNQSADIGSDKKTVTFDTAGTYVFTIKAVNDEITRTATITVTVLAEDVVPPVITVNTAEKDDLLLTGDSVQYVLDYSVSPETATVTVACNQQSGADIDSDNKTVTFTAAGVYTFTIKAVNDGVTETETIVVTVTEKPAFTAAPEDGSLTLQTVEWDHKNDPTSRPSYAVSYEVSGTESVVLTETTDIGGWWFDEANNVIYFTKGGSYEFNLTASNAAGSAEETFTVEVADLYEEGNWNESVIWEQQFNTESKPDGWTYTNDGTGVTWTQDGVSFANGANDKEFVDYAFAEEMTGLVEFDVDFTISEQVWADKEAGKYNSYWANIFFINDKSSGSKTTISVAIVDNQIWINQGNDAGGWQDFSAFESQKMRVVPGEKYTLRAVLDTDTQRMYLYLLGENRIADGVDGNPGETVSFGGSAYLGNFDFRDNTGKILMYRMGSDNGSAYFTMHSIVAKQLTEKTDPVVTVTESNAQVTLEGGSAQYTLQYSVDPADAAVEISCDKQTGFKLEGDVVTFTEEGTYVFTVKATKDGVSGEGKITVSVAAEGAEAPAVDVTVAEKTLTLTDGKVEYALEYTVTPAGAAVTVTCDQTQGFTLNDDNKTVEFTAVGVYTFTVKAENDGLSDEATIVITVNEALTFTAAPEDDELTLQDSRIDATNDASMIATQSASIVITYEVSDPEATVVLAETTDIGGWYFDQANGKIYFTRGGEYQFKLTATNDAGSAEETFKVSVTDLYTKDVTANWNDFENWQFNTTEKPADWTEEELAGDGFRNWTANGLEMGRTSNSGSSFVHHQFEEPVTGVLEFTVEFTIDPESTSNFANIFFLVNGVNNGDSSVITVAVENNRLRVCENSGKWRAPAIMGHNGVYIVGGQKYTLRAIINTTTERVYLYIDGESLYEDGTRTETFELGGEAYLGNFDFRDNGNAINYYRMGSNNGIWVKFTVHSIVAKRLKQAPTFTTTQKDESLTLQTEVWNASAPTTSRPHVTLSYEISASPAAEMLLEETTEIGGWTYDAEEGVIYFTRGGEYQFKLTATNSEGSADCTFAVDVTDLYALENSTDAPVIFEQQFNSTTKPDGWTETIGTPGTDSITYSENGVTIHKDTSGKSAFLQYDFEEALNGVVEFTLNFKTTDTTFANIFFLRGNDNNYAVTVAVQKNILIVREENSWSNSINLFNNTKTRLVPGVDYTLRAVVDCENERVYLYISGESLIADGEGGNAGENAAMGDNLYLGNFDFRANGQPVLAYRFGSDGNGGTTEFTVYSIVAKQLSPVVTVNQSSAAVDFRPAGRMKGM